MSTSTQNEVLLGCTQQVRVVVTEDGGNLVIRVYAQDPDTTDVDALFFNLAEGVDATGLTIYPEYDEAIGSNGENVTGFDVTTGTLNQLNNGAQIQQSYDVRLEFGTVPYSSGGDVDQAALTLYVDGGGTPLTADSIDLSNLTAVINSDSGNGLALTSGSGTDAPTFTAADYASVGAGDSSVLEIENDSSDELTLSWIDYDGEVVDYQTIAAGQSVTQHTYESHNWILTNTETGEVTYLGAAGQGTTVRVEDASEGGNTSTGGDEVVLSADFEGIHSPDASQAVASGGHWDVQGGELSTDGCNDGQIWFNQVAVGGDALISFDARAPHTENFEDGGCYGDELQVWALVDGTTWVELDTFTANADGTALVGDETGQTITSTSQTLEYSGGELDGADTVQLYMYSDISAANEQILFDNVEVAVAGDEVTEEGSNCATTTTIEQTVASEDFDTIHYASQSNLINSAGGWDVENGELTTDGWNDGSVCFDEVPVDGPAAISFDARSPHTENFEAGGCYGDELQVWALVDGTNWVELDTFTVNAEGTALVGDETGQTITSDSQTLEYSGGALEDAETVQLYLYSDISASNEEIMIDNVTIAETSEAQCFGIPTVDCEEYDVLYDEPNNNAEAELEMIL